MTVQAAFDFDAPARDLKRTIIPENIPDPDKCENLECKNKHLPGRQMCRACARLFGAYMQGRILGWKNV